MSTITDKYGSFKKGIQSKHAELLPNASYTIWDGLFSPEKYANSLFRVLVMNREPYDIDKDSYDLVDTIQNDIKNGNPFWVNQNTLKNNLRDMLAVTSFLSDDNINAIDDATIENRIKEYHESDDAFNQALLRMGYINIKKSNGQKKSNPKDLREHAILTWDVTQSQISFFNPSLIIGGNIVDKILGHKDMHINWGENLYTESKYIKIFTLKIGAKTFPFIDSYHLSANSYGEKGNRKPMSEYYKELILALRNVENNNPGYWATRRNLSVFED